MGKIKFNLVRSARFTIGIVWAERGSAAKIIRIFISEDSKAVLGKIRSHFPGVKKGQDKKICPASKRIKAYLKGEGVRFNLRDIEIDPRPEFQREAYCSLMKIPPGKVITYKGLAGLMGRGSARAVGNAMAKNPFPIIVPCHRVVSFTRNVGDFQSGRALKKKLLAAEGVKFDKKGRVLSQYFYNIQ